MYINIYTYIYPPCLPRAEYGLKSIFIWNLAGQIQSFPSPRLVAILRLKIPVCQDPGSIFSDGNY